MVHPEVLKERLLYLLQINTPINGALCISYRTILPPSPRASILQKAKPLML